MISMSAASSASAMPFIFVANFSSSELVAVVEERTYGDETPLGRGFGGLGFRRDTLQERCIM